MTAALDPGTAVTARNRHRQGGRLRFSALLSVAPLLFVCSTSTAQEPDGPPAATAGGLKGRDVFLRVCTTCHPAERVIAQGRSRAQGDEVMVTMRTARGVMFTDEDFSTVLSYLAAAHGPDSATPPPPGGRGPRPAWR